MIQSPIGKIRPTGHAKDRINQHSISEAYIERLLDRPSEWEWRWASGRVVGSHERDGVRWEIVIQPEEQWYLFGHDWMLVTIYPAEVDVAEAVGAHGMYDALNLAFYSD